VAVSSVKLIVDAANAINPLKRVANETAKTEKQVNLLKKAIKLQGAAIEAVATKLSQFGNMAKAAFGKAQEAAQKYQSTLGGLKGAIVSLGVAALTKRMIGQAASFAQTQVRLKALSNEYGEFGKIQQLVKDNAKTFNQSQAESASNFSDVYARLRPLGTSLEDIQTVYKGFNATALASGTSAAAASGAFLQLSQALGSGRLQGDEFRSIAEQVPGILRLVADEMGVTVGELKQLGSDGKITSDILINSLAKGFEENKDKIQALLAESPAQKFKEFSNATSELSNAIGTELLPVVTPAVEELTKLLKAAGSLPKPLLAVAAAIAGLGSAAVIAAPGVVALGKAIAFISGAGLLAAAPWLALAAGIGAVVVALGRYQSKSATIANAARTGGAKEVVAARQELSKLSSENSLLSLDIKEASNSRERQRLKGEIRKNQGRINDLKAAIAANPADIAQAQVADVPKQDQFKIGDFVGGGGGVVGGGGSTAKGPDPAEGAEKLLKQQLEAGAKLSQQFTRQIELKEASSDLAREELQVEFDRQDALATIAETAEISQQASLNELANKIAVLDIEEARGKVAAKQAKEQQERDKAAAEAAQRRLEADPGFQMQKQFGELIKLENQVAAGATAIGDAFSNAFVGVISGAKSAQEGLAEMMQSVAKHFLDMATKIIAEQIAMILYGTIMKALGVSMPGGSSPGIQQALAVTPKTGAAATSTLTNFLSPRANGGPVSANTPYIVGERGPELMIPSTSGMVLSNSETRQQLTQQDSAMRSTEATRQQLNTQRNTMITNSTRETERMTEMMLSNPDPIDVRYESTVINNVEYVTAEQHRQGMAQAAERGRSLTLSALQGSVKTRKKVGLS
jgi:tape measure domain-containing protein